MKRRPDDFALRCLLVTSALLTACGRSQSAAVRAGVDTLWLIAREPARDAIHASDSETSLRARYGDWNVVAGVVELGEGERETGAILFPHDSTRRLTVLWRDTLRRAGAKRPRIGGAPTRWLVTPGITLGTSLAELERLNGRPFRLFGMGFDYSGTAESWEGGRLDTLWRPSPGVLHLAWLRLQPDSGADRGLVQQGEGDRPFSSSNPAMQKLNPKVYDVFIEPR